MATKLQQKLSESWDGPKKPYDYGELVISAGVDELVWDLASLLCRECWQPWWKHGHGPFASLVDESVDHLFDAL